MDHVIDGIKEYLDIELELLTEELQSGKYKKLSDCPSYGSCKAMVDAIHVLEKYYYGEAKTLPVKELVRGLE